MRKSLACFVALLMGFMLSCTDSDDKLIHMRVNHYQVPYQALFFPALAYQVQYNQANNDQWEYFGAIEGFEFESGYVYEIVILQEHVENPPQDASSENYSLVNVVSKTPVDPTASFQLTLSSPFPAETAPFVTKNESGNFMLVNTILINCGNLCDELEEKLQQGVHSTGKFVHGENHSITLIELN